MKKDLSKGCWISGQGWDGMNTCTHNPVSSRNFIPTFQSFPLHFHFLHDQFKLPRES